MHRLFPLLTIALLGCMSEYELQVDEQAKQQDLATAMHDDAIDRSGPVAGLFPPLQLPPPGTSWFPPEQPGAIRPTLGSGQASPGNVPVTSTGSETAIVPATVPTPDLPTGIEQGCPALPQDLLIVDLKSGWWSGDGGEFFEHILSGIGDPCLGRITIDYHHVTNAYHATLRTGGSSGSSELRFYEGEPRFGKVFGATDWDTYEQIWILSGSEADPLDLPVQGDFFQKLAQHLVASDAAVFLGAGFGSITHGNALAEALDLGTIFDTREREGGLLSPQLGGVEVVDYLELVAQHPMFQEVTSVVERVRMAGGMIELEANPSNGFEGFLNGLMAPPRVVAGSDRIINGRDFEALAKNATGDTVIAVGKASLARRIVLDSGLQRFYAVAGQNGAGTLAYLRNMVLYLSGVR